MRFRLAVAIDVVCHPTPDSSERLAAHDVAAKDSADAARILRRRDGPSRNRASRCRCNREPECTSALRARVQVGLRPVHARGGVFTRLSRETSCTKSTGPGGRQRYVVTPNRPNGPGNFPDGTSRRNDDRSLLGMRVPLSTLGPSYASMLNEKSLKGAAGVAAGQWMVGPPSQPE
jgi:hypothetical protein